MMFEGTIGALHSVLSLPAHLTRTLAGGCIVVALWIAAAPAAYASPAVQIDSRVYEIAIPRTPLAVALRLLARQVGLQIAEFSDVEANLPDVGPVVGMLTREQALDRLLSGTGLTYRFVNDHTVAIQRPTAVTAPHSADRATAVEPTAAAAGNPSVGKSEFASSPLPSEGSRAPQPKSFLARLAAVFGVCVVTAGGPACAQSTAPATQAVLEEIVVTAERRTERLMEVPMSIAAFSQDKLDQQGLRSVDDLTRVSPGVTFLRNGAGSTGNYNDEGSDVAIRGIDSSAGASTTGIYLDDTPIQTRHLNFGTVNPFPALFDLERVEVLRGPQGTLFGAGSEGGTIRFLTPEPSLTTFSGYARAEYGTIDGGGQNYEAGVAIGGPVIDGVLGFRVSASFREEGGWVNRVTYAPPSGIVVNTAAFGPATVYSGSPTISGIAEKNANWHDTATLRAAFKWQPSGNLAFEPSVYVQTLHINDTGAYWLNLSDPASNTYNNGNAQRDPSTDPWYIAALKINWDLPGARLTSNTSYFSRSQHSVSDYSQWLPSVYALNQYQYAVDGAKDSAIFADRQDNFTQEIRLASTGSQAPVQWTAGLFYMHAHENEPETVISPDAGILYGVANALAPGFVWVSQPKFNAIDKQYAAFGDVTTKLSDAFKFTVGLRYSKIDYSGLVYRNPTLANFYHGVDTEFSGTDKPVTPRVVLNYEPSADSLYYLSAAKGFRPGGANAPLPANCTAGLPSLPATFNSDSLWHYELGLKDSLLDRRLQVTASVYYLRWSNIQQFVYLNCGLGFSDNLGQAEGRGGDIEINWRVTPDLTVGLSAAYTDTYYTENVAIPGSSFLSVSTGDHLPAAPWNVNASLEYVWKTVVYRPYARVDFQYATAQRSLTPYQDAANAPSDDPTLPGLPEMRVLSIRGGLRFDGVDVSVFIQNALNFHTPLLVARDVASTAANGFATASGQEVNYDTNYLGHGLTPRTIGVTATYRW